MYAQSLHSCLTICYFRDCSQPGSSVHRILQARIPEWVAMPSSRGSSGPRDRTQVACVSCSEGGFFPFSPSRSPLVGTNSCLPVSLGAHNPFFTATPPTLIVPSSENLSSCRTFSLFFFFSSSCDGTSWLFPVGKWPRNPDGHKSLPRPCVRVFGKEYLETASLFRETAEVGLKGWRGILRFSYSLCGEVLPIRSRPPSQKHALNQLMADVLRLYPRNKGCPCKHSV